MEFLNHQTLASVSNSGQALLETDRLQQQKTTPGATSVN